MASFPGDQKNPSISDCFRILPPLLGGRGVLSPGAININICDYWEPHIIGADIATKKTLALNNVLQSFRDTVRNSWVDAFVDSQVLLRSWNRRGSCSHSWVAALKCLFETTMSLNIDLHVHFVLTLHLVVSVFSHVGFGPRLVRRPQGPLH